MWSLFAEATVGMSEGSAAGITIAGITVGAGMIGAAGKFLAPQVFGFIEKSRAEKAALAAKPFEQIAGKDEQIRMLIAAMREDGREMHKAALSMLEKNTAAFGELSAQMSRLSDGVCDMTTAVQDLKTDMIQAAVFRGGHS